MSEVASRIAIAIAIAIDSDFIGPKPSAIFRQEDVRRWRELLVELIQTSPVHTV